MQYPNVIQNKMDGGWVCVCVCGGGGGGGGGGGQGLDFLPFFTREATFVTSCLLACISNPFWKGVFSKKNALLKRGLL